MSCAQVSARATPCLHSAPPSQNPFPLSPIQMPLAGAHVKTANPCRPLVGLPCSRLPRASAVLSSKKLRAAQSANGEETISFCDILVFTVNCNYIVWFLGTCLVCLLDLLFCAIRRDCKTVSEPRSCQGLFDLCANEAYAEVPCPSHILKALCFNCDPVRLFEAVFLHKPLVPAKNNTL